MVAPPAGAWIETFWQPLTPFSCIVAPPAGAWIETYNSITGITNIQSLPPRERGLKLATVWGIRKVIKVAPPAGAWIETFL